MSKFCLLSFWLDTGGTRVQGGSCITTSSGWGTVDGNNLQKEKQNRTACPLSWQMWLSVIEKARAEIFLIWGTGRAERQNSKLTRQHYKAAEFSPQQREIKKSYNSIMNALCVEGSHFAKLLQQWDKCCLENWHVLMSREITCAFTLLSLGVIAFNFVPVLIYFYFVFLPQITLYLSMVFAFYHKFYDIPLWWAREHEGYCSWQGCRRNYI